MRRIVNIFIIILIITFAASCGSSSSTRKNPYYKKKKKEFATETTKLGKNKMFFSKDYQRKLKKRAKKNQKARR